MKFLGRSLFILLLLYGLVFAVGDMYLMHQGAPLWAALAFPIVFVAAQYLIGPWLIEQFVDIFWDDDCIEFPARNREFIERLCAERGLKVPRIGVIFSGSPNAFSFGRRRRDARVVVTTGLLKSLSTEETNAVLAHEMGHIEHRDFLVMTIASLVPLLLYQFYSFTERIDNLRVVAYTAYGAYLLSRYVVLMLNRTREYWADHYSGETTHNPDALSSALVKIAYGMIKANGEYQEARASGEKEKGEWRRQRRLSGSLALMGISNFRSGAALALATNPSEAARVMRWDLVNPWAQIYEISSTHPLTALRIRELNRQSESLQKPLAYPLLDQERLHWGTFPFEVLLWALPFIIGTVLLILVGETRFLFRTWGIVLPPELKPMLLMLTGAAWLMRTFYRYGGSFQDSCVGALLEDVTVSQMRPTPVRLKGTIVGNGMPGVFWSPDLVLRDSTGIIFVLYRQTIPFARFIFGVTAADQYIDQEVQIEGWFRRGLKPYVEMAKITGDRGTTHRTYSRWVQSFLSVCLVVAGWIWLTR